MISSAINSSRDPRGILLNTSRQDSNFKMKVWKTDGRGYTLYSFDYESERQDFKDPAVLQDLTDQWDEIGICVFDKFNGFNRMTEHAKKIYDQGLLKKAYIFCNKILVLNPKISNVPIPILLCKFEYQKSTSVSI